MKLSQKWIDLLVKLPETGMGYQRVTIHLKNGEKRKEMMITNCENIESQFSQDKTNFSEEDIIDITMP